MLKTTVFKVQINCPGCNMYHTATRLTGEETCQHCGKIIHVEELFGSKILGAVELVKLLNAFLSGNIQTLGGKGGVDHVGAYKLSYTTANVYCEECHEPISEVDVRAAIQNQKPLICGKCEHPMPVKKADADLLEIHPKLEAIINDSSGVDGAEINSDKEHMLVFGCMTCGSGLQLTKETGRTAKCNHCGNENYLPDMIWNKLHPSKEVSPLFVVLDVNESDMQEAIHYFTTSFIGSGYKRHFIQFIEEYFGKPFENEAIQGWFKLLLTSKNDNAYKDIGVDIEKLQTVFYEQLIIGYDNQFDSIKQITAEYGNKIPEALQNKLAEDKNEEVKLALTKNKSLHKEARKKLEDDSSPVIAEEAQKNKKGFFKKLFG